MLSSCSSGPYSDAVPAPPQDCRLSGQGRVLRSGVKGLRFRVQGLNFSFQGLGYRV